MKRETRLWRESERAQGAPGRVLYVATARTDGAPGRYVVEVDAVHPVGSRIAVVRCIRWGWVRAWRAARAAVLDHADLRDYRVYDRMGEVEA